jgi:hypothetical protein
MRQNLGESSKVGNAFKHAAKVRAINAVFTEREALFARYESAARESDEAVIAFCETLPSIDPVTRYRIAKNLGIDCAKPDIWLSRVADASGEDVQTLCRRLALQSGDTVATVDSIIWRVCEQGWWVHGDQISR